MWGGQSIIIQYYQRVTNNLRDGDRAIWRPRTFLVRKLEPRVTFIVSLHFTWLLILLLPERKFLNIIPAVAGMSAATFISSG